MSDYDDDPNFDDEEEDTPTGNVTADEEDAEENSGEEVTAEAGGQPPAVEEAAPAAVTGPEEKKPAASDDGGKAELCPYCGQPLSQKMINGKVWYVHEGNSECKAIFHGIAALKEARDLKALMEEEKQKEKEQQDREEAERRVREEAEKPFREAAQKTAEFAVDCLKKELKQIQEQYAAMLESQAKDLETTRQKLESLLQQDIPTQIPERSKLSNAIEAYKTKLNQSSAGDPNAQSYEYLENSFNELLAARDEAEALIQSTNKSAQTIKARLEAAIRDAQEKMESAASDGKEYEIIQNEITKNGQGTVLALEKQLENLERLFFRTT